MELLIINELNRLIAKLEHCAVTVRFMKYGMYDIKIKHKNRVKKFLSSDSACIITQIQKYLQTL